jgi:hypothetical protein
MKAFAFLAVLVGVAVYDVGTTWGQTTSGLSMAEYHKETNSLINGLLDFGFDPVAFKCMIGKSSTNASSTPSTTLFPGGPVGPSPGNDRLRRFLNYYKDSVFWMRYYADQGWVFRATAEVTESDCHSELLSIPILFPRDNGSSSMVQVRRIVNQKANSTVSTTKAMLLFHGGAFVVGNSNTHFVLGCHLSNVSNMEVYCKSGLHRFVFIGRHVPHSSCDFFVGFFGAYLNLQR